jgi:hypothetical protein
VYYAQVVQATAIAIAQTLPTPSPIPNAGPRVQEWKKREYLADASMRTAVAMYPPPPGYDPSSEFTPDTSTPLPTEKPYPYVATENGRIYSHSLMDDPEGKMIAHVNHWSGKIDNGGVTLFAGHHKENAAQGLLMTREVDPQDPEKLRFQFYATPTQSGAIRIIAETGGQFTLQAADGTTFIFDLNTRQWVSPSLTPVTTPVDTPTLLPREQKATEIVRFENEQATVMAQSTSFALGTPYPTSRPVTPRPTNPAITPVPGINTDCANADMEFSFVNCWNALIGDEYVFADTVVLKADPSQAVLHVYTATLNLDDISPIESYPMLERVERVRISSVSWPLMTLTALQTDPQTTFAFDLATRQWVSPPSTPGPSPSALISPVPSVSPMATHSP